MSVLDVLGINLETDFIDPTKPELQSYIKRAAETVLAKFENPLDDKEAPQLQTDFSNICILAGLPKVGDDKLDKLIDVLIKQILKKGIDFVTKEKIDMPKQGD